MSDPIQVPVEDSGVDENEYQKLIKDVYITPIRSVLAVDDEFPTLYQYLKKETDKTALVGKDKARLNNIIELCHENSRNWMLDVQNGEGVDLSKDVPAIKRLQKSDLLILDYHLEGDSADSRKSRNIIRQVAENDHFNIVMVYTDEKPSVAFREILLSLLSPWDDIKGEDPDGEDEAEWNDGLDEDILSSFKATIDDTTYLYLRKYQITSMDNQDATSYLAKFESAFEKVKDDVGLNKDECLHWALRAIEKDCEIQNENLDGVNWDFGDTKTKNWLRTSRLFLTVVSKEEHGLLIDELVGALTCWNPSPNRLIASQLRNEISKRGVSAEDEALMDYIMQCGWLDKLISSKEENNRVEILQMIERNSSGLIGALQEEVVDFSNKVISLLKTDDIKSHSFFNIDEFNDKLKRDARYRQNAHICSMAPKGYHLTTGHVIEVDNELWVCLTPACDLVPGQNSKKHRFKVVHPSMPAKFVKLHEVDLSGKPGTLDKYFKTHRCVFLKIGTDIRVFNIHPGNDVKSEPEWEQMLALNLGKFTDSKFSLEIGRLKKAKKDDYINEAEDSGEKVEDDLTVRPALSYEWKEAKVVAHLRYEYAINLMNVLGNSMTRIGLDFV